MTDGATPSSRAAPEKLPSRATRTKALMLRSVLMGFARGNDFRLEVQESRLTARPCPELPADAARHEYESTLAECNPRILRHAHVITSTLSHNENRLRALCEFRVLHFGAATRPTRLGTRASMPPATGTVMWSTAGS